MYCVSNVYIEPNWIAEQGLDIEHSKEGLARTKVNLDILQMCSLCDYGYADVETTLSTKRLRCMYLKVGTMECIKELATLPCKHILQGGLLSSTESLSNLQDLLCPLHYLCSNMSTCFAR